MEIIFSEEAKNHIIDYKLAGNKSSLKKIRILLESIIKSPYEGIGKPEALKYNYSGKWSRRISKEHRLIYEVKENNTIYVFGLKGHY